MGSPLIEMENELIGETPSCLHIGKEDPSFSSRINSLPLWESQLRKLQVKH